MKAEIKTDLHEIETRLMQARQDLFARYPIRSLGIFGSVARGEDAPESDLDILVDFSEPVGFEIVDLALELEALLGRPVDLVSRRAIRARMWPYNEKDLIYL